MTVAAARNDASYVNFREAGYWLDKTVDQLLTEALLHPELARTLLMKATPANRPFIAQRLRSQLGTLALAGAAPSTQKR